MVAPRPQDGVDVTAVTASITLDPATLEIDASATLEVAHPGALPTLTLGLDDVLDVVAVRLNGQPAAFERVGDAVSVALAGSGTESVVEIQYRGTPDAGVYADDAAGQRVVYTDGWPDRTAGWLPAVHHPSDDATLDLTLSVPAAFEVVASGRQVTDAVADGRRTARFVLSSPAPPYTWAWAVADFEAVEQDGVVPVRHSLLAADRGLADRLARTPQILATLAELLGPYPYDTYATVQVPMAYAGMENAAAPFLRAELYDQVADGRTPIEEVNVHEIVHQWWGNAVVPADWRDLWIAEGAATYLTTEVYDRLDGPDAGRNFRTLMSRQIGAADAARRLAPASYDDPADVLTPTVYQKGGAVYHLLRLTLGDAVFFDALRAVQRDFADRPLSTDAFRRALEASSGRDLGPLFDRWVTGEGLPVLKTRWDRDTRTLAWEIVGDDGTLDGVGFELYVRQGDASWFVPATDGVFTPSGTDRPTVEPVGVLLTVEDYSVASPTPWRRRLRGVADNSDNSARWQPTPPGERRPTSHVPRPTLVISLFLADIDGCLSEPYQPFRLDGFRQLREWGANSDPRFPRVGICSGRAYAYVEAVAQALALQAPALFESGGGRFDLDAARITWNPALTPSVEADLADCRAFLVSEVVTQSPTVSFDYGKRSQAGIVGPVPGECETFLPQVQAFVADRPGLVAYHTPYSVDVVPQALTKVEALRWLAASDGLTMGEIAFIGDTNGDAPAIAACGFGAAPANGAADRARRRRPGDAVADAGRRPRGVPRLPPAQRRRPIIVREGAFLWTPGRSELPVPLVTARDLPIPSPRPPPTMLRLLAALVLVLSIPASAQADAESPDPTAEFGRARRRLRRRCRSGVLRLLAPGDGARSPLRDRRARRRRLRIRDGVRVLAEDGGLRADGFVHGWRLVQAGDERGYVRAAALSNLWIRVDKSPTACSTSTAAPS